MKDFPPEAAESYEIVLDLAPVDVFAVLRSQAECYQREPRDVHGLLDRLDAGGAPHFAAEFRRRL